MSKREITVQLEFSPDDQKVLNYQARIQVFDYEKLMRQPLSFSVETETKDEIIRAIRRELSIPEGYLNDYQIVFKENVLLVIP